MTNDVFSVVFVCTGNRFRSPLAERLFQQLTGDVPVSTSSHGTLELGARPALPEAVEEAARLGVDLSSHRSTSLAGADLSEADLVIGFERMHVVTAVVDANAPRARTFTLPQLVELLERSPDLPQGGGVAAARRAVATAGGAPSDRPFAPPEVRDPIGRPRRVATDVADEVHDLCRRLVVGLFGG